MAETEKRYLDIEIREGEAIKDLTQLKTKIDELKAAQKEMKGTTEENSEAYIANEVRLKTLQKEYSSNRNELVKLTQGMNSAKGSNERYSAAISVFEKRLSKVNTTTKEGQDEAARLKRAIDRLNGAVTKNSSEMGKQRRNIGNYKSATEGLSGAMGQLSPAFAKAGQAAQMLGKLMTFALGPIGLILAAVAGVVAAVKSFTSASEEGENALTKWQATASAVFNVFRDRMANAGKALVDFFTENEDGVSGFDKAWSGLTEKIKGYGSSISETFSNIWNNPKEAFNNFVDGFNGVIDGLKNRAESAFNIVKANIERFFAGADLLYQKFVDKFSDNEDGIAAAQERYNEAVVKSSEENKKLKDAIDGISKSVNDSGVVQYFKELNNELKNDVEQTKLLADRTAALTKSRRVELVNEANLRLKISKLRDEVARKEEVSTERRLEALDEAVKLENVILNEKIKNAKEELSIQRETNALSLSNTEDLQKEAELEAKLLSLQAESFKRQKTLQAERTTVLREEASERIKELNVELQLFLQINKSKIDKSKEFSKEAKAAELERINTVEKKEMELLNQKKTAGLLSENEYQLAKLKIEENYNGQRLTLENTYQDNKKKLQLEKQNQANQDLQNARKQFQQDQFDAELVLSDEHEILRIEKEREILTNDYEAKLENARRIGADTTQIEAAYSAQKRRLAVMEFQAKASVAADFANNIATIAGKNSKVGKAAAAAATTVSALQAATGAYASLAGIPIIGPVLGATAAAAALAAGFINVKKIYQTKSGLPGDTGSGGGGLPSGGQAPAPNVPTNVTAELGKGLINRDLVQNNQENKTQTVLVVDDVTEAQGTEDRINQVSSI